MLQMLLKDYNRLYQAHYMLIIESFFRMMKKDSFQKEWYFSGYVIFEQFLKQSAATKTLNKLILSENPDILALE